MAGARDDIIALRPLKHRQDDSHHLFAHGLAHSFSAHHAHVDEFAGQARHLAGACFCGFNLFRRDQGLFDEQVFELFAGEIADGKFRLAVLEEDGFDRLAARQPQQAAVLLLGDFTDEIGDEFCAELSLHRRNLKRWTTGSGSHDHSSRDINAGAGRVHFMLEAIAAQ